MQNIILSGCGGRLGAEVIRIAESCADLRVIAGIDPSQNAVGHSSGFGFPVASSPDELSGFDFTDCVIADCSHHTAAIPLIGFAVREKLPVVIATTGHDADEVAAIKTAALRIPVFYSRNMSLGVNVLLTLVKNAAAALPGFDIEIVEEHHRRKLDAPSGTALMLADAACEGRGEKYEYVTDRSKRSEKRHDDEIGISSVRGGGIVGEHEVIFASDNEVIRLSHHAADRAVFADGIISAVRFIAGRPTGLYNMQSLVDAALSGR